MPVECDESFTHSGRCYSCGFGTARQKHAIRLVKVSWHALKTIDFVGWTESSATMDAWSTISSTVLANAVSQVHGS